MNYGNFREEQCLNCGSNADKHGISVIKSDDKTEKLAKKLQSLLDAQEVSSRTRGLDSLRGTCMVGSLIAKIGSELRQFATVSGGDVAILNQVSTMGKGVEIVKTGAVDPARLITITGKPVAMTRDRYDGWPNAYPVGSCAAQKMLQAAFAYARDKGRSITGLNMAEILWTGTSGHNREWSTGDVVPSCETCKRVVVAMLCDQGG